MTLVCFLIGHKFVYVPGYGSIHYSDFCLRCGKRPAPGATEGGES